MIRRVLLFTLTLVAFLGALTAALATMQQRDFMLRGYVDATQTTDLPFRTPRLGVNVELIQYAPDELIEQLDLMAATGFTWLRQYFPWNEIEPIEGEYHWERWDHIVETVSAYPHLELVAVLVNTPEWARSDQAATVTAPPASPDEFARFAHDFAQRYGASIRFYQVWDEPNIEIGWGELEPRTADYAALLQAAYPALHSAASDVTVIGAALAPTTERGPRNISDIVYLRDMYAFGAADFVDAFAAKPYGFAFSPYDREVSAEHLNFSRIVALREVMVEHGDGRKALWASSWGWNSLPQDWPGPTSIWGQISPEAREYYTLEALNRTEREWPWLGGMILQHWQPVAPPDDPIWGFALVDIDGNSTPLLQMLGERPMPTAAMDGLYHARNRYARYSGIWRFSEFGADMGWVQDSRFEFDFVGSDIALLLRQDNYLAHFYVTIDDQPANALPRDAAGNTYVVLRSSILEPEVGLVQVANRLSGEIHTLRGVADELIPDEPLSRWPLVGYAVSSGDLSAPYNRQIVIAWATTAVALLAVIITGMRVAWLPLYRRFDFLWRFVGNAGAILIGVITSLALLAGMFLTWNDGTPEIFRRDSVQLGLSVATAGLIYLNEFGVVITIVAGIFLFVLIYQRIELGLMLTLFWIPFFLFPVELYRFAFPMAEVIILITTAAWALKVLVAWGRERQSEVRQFPLPGLRAWIRKLTPLDYLMCGWVLLGIVSLLWVEHRSVAVTELRTMIVQPVLFYLILRTLPLNRCTLLRLVDALLVAGGVVAVIGLFLWLRGEAVITAEEGVRRMASVYGSPNNVGLLMGRCIPFALAFVLLPLDQRRRLIAGVLLLLMATSAILSLSAGALFLGLPVAVAGVLFLCLKRRAILPLLGLLLLGVVVTGIALQSPRFSRVLDITQGTNFYRIRVWQSTAQIIADYPLTGIGLDQFLYRFRGEYIMPDAWEEPDLSHPHNVILDFWVRLGLAGVGWFAVIQVFFWRKMRRWYSLTAHEPLLRAIYIGTMGAMLNLLAHGLVDNSVFVLDMAYIFVVLIGIASTPANIGAIDEGL
jgi:O-antigen ligase